MSNLKNKVSLIGRVGMQPEKKSVGNGYTLTRFSLAVNEGVKDKVTGEWKNNTTWHNIQAWGKTAERICSVVEKGTEIAMEGKLISRSYETKTGEKRNTIEIELNDFVLVGKKQVVTL
jgi:single-strand DNA-binding protein